MFFIIIIYCWGVLKTVSVLLFFFLLFWEKEQTSNLLEISPEFRKKNSSKPENT